MKRSPMPRGKHLQAKKRLNPVSAKKRARKASADGKAGKEHMSLVARLPCVICGSQPVEVHHVICGRYSTKKASDFDTLPVCYEHHRGASGIHSGKASWVARYGQDTDYLPAVREAVERLKK